MSAFLKARGGFEIDADWEGKAVRNLTISSQKGGKTTLLVNGKKISVSLKPGESKTLQW